MPRSETQPPSGPCSSGESADKPDDRRDDRDTDQDAYQRTHPALLLSVMCLDLSYPSTAFRIADPVPFEAVSRLRGQPSG
jgi:hypothetical protein